MECRLAGETEFLGENLAQRHFCPSQNPTWPYPGLNPGRRGGKPATNRLSYGAALVYRLLTALRSMATEIRASFCRIRSSGSWMLSVNGGWKTRDLNEEITRGQIGWSGGPRYIPVLRGNTIRKEIPHNNHGNPWDIARSTILLKKMCPH
jgi:hypothetical protein